MYAKYGSAGSYQANFKSKCGQWQNGFVLYDNAGSGDCYFGIHITNMGDVNADGIDDFAVSDIFTNSHAGAVYVVFGAHNIPASFYTAQLNGNNGFKIDCTKSGS
ncbi:MAG: integrin alpha [Candidatus Midichloria sp.]|nr:integrin alpha [Candidatus Midichloria sp.]